MRSLYWRIFLSFWLALALILVGTVTVAVNAELRQRFTLPWAERTEIYIDATKAFETGGPKALDAWLRQLQPADIRAQTYVIDPEGHEVLGRAIPDFLRLDAAPAAGPPRSVLATPRPAGGPLVLVGPDGRTFHVLVGRLRAGPHLFGELEIPAVSLATLLIALAVSAVVCFFLARYLDTMAEQVRQLLESKQQLLRDVSHELRSPLARLQIALSLARREEGAVARHLDRIGGEADRLEQLIARTLGLARLDRAPPPVEATPVNLSELLDHIVADVTIEADAQGCVVALQHERSLLVRGDAELLRSSLENVVRNAVRYSPKGGRVVIAGRRRPQSRQIEVVVEDQGPGVPEADLKLIFEPFYRVDAARDRAAGGEGLGLAIAARAVLLHAGSIEAYNIGSAGLAVRILLPEEPASAEEREPPLRAASNGARNRELASLHGPQGGRKPHAPSTTPGQDRGNE